MRYEEVRRDKRKCVEVVREVLENEMKNRLQNRFANINQTKGSALRNNCRPIKAVDSNNV